jgi:hypothetical protein
MKAIVGVWKNDPCKIPQLYEFKSWGDALEFYKQEHENFTIMYHFIMPGVLPF